MINWKDCVNKSAGNERVQDIQSYLVSAFGCQKVLKSIDFTDIFGDLWYTVSAKKNVVF